MPRWTSRSAPPPAATEVEAPETNSLDTTEKTGAVTLPFDPKVQIPFVEKDGEMFVSVREIVAGMGLSWSRHREKIKYSGDRFEWTQMRSVAQDGRQRPVIVMPLKQINGWLFTTNSNKVRAYIKPTVQLYQEKCFEVLYDYWNSQSCSMRTAKGDVYDAAQQGRSILGALEAQEAVSFIRDISEIWERSLSMAEGVGFDGRIRREIADKLLVETKGVSMKEVPGIEEFPEAREDAR